MSLYVSIYKWDLNKNLFSLFRQLFIISKILSVSMSLVAVLAFKMVIEFTQNMLILILT